MILGYLPQSQDVIYEKLFNQTMSKLWLYLVRFAEDDLVVTEAKRISVERHRVQVDVRVGALRLAGARAVKVPDRQLWKWMQDQRN